MVLHSLYTRINHFSVCRLEGKVALITGGASGIGEATARLFARHGAKVVVADMQDDLGHALCQDIGSDGSVTFTHCDVTNESDMSNAVDGAVAKYGKLDIMFSNAGISGPLNAIRRTEHSDFKKVFDVNVLGAFFGAKHAARVMIPEKKGSIIFTSSSSSIMATGVSHLYPSSKHAVVGLANNLCVELGQYGIRVNCIAPFITETPLLKNVQNMLDKEGEKDPSEESINIGQSMLQPVDIAQAAVFLGSDESRYVSGVNLPIDGGYTKFNPSFDMLVKHQA